MAQVHSLARLLQQGLKLLEEWQGIGGELSALRSSYFIGGSCNGQLLLLSTTHLMHDQQVRGIASQRPGQALPQMPRFLKLRLADDIETLKELLATYGEHCPPQHSTPTKT